MTVRNSKPREYLEVLGSNGRPRNHGFLHETRGGKLVFVREVIEKDRMRIYDSWSIHPLVLEKYGAVIDGVAFISKDEGITYYASLKVIQDHGIMKTFGGGKTIYIARGLCAKIVNKTKCIKLSKKF